jgi:GNAT superfamily N-acetyltransferase
MKRDINLCTLDTYQPNYLEGMVQVYNTQTASEPHIASLTPDRFVELVVHKSYFDPDGLIVARQDGEVTGWIHACQAPGTEPWSPDGIASSIRMVFYPPGELPVGQMLLAEASAWLKSKGGARLNAFSPTHGYPFYRGLWAGSEPMLPFSFSHLHMLLDGAGFHLAQEEVLMTCRLDDPPGLPAAPGLELTEQPTRWYTETMRESWVGFEPHVTLAIFNGSEAGHICWVVLPHVAEKLGAPCLSIWGLGVNEAHRRAGIASALVGHALSKGYRMGASFGSVGTQLWNVPAQKTYLKYGFQPHAILGGREYIPKQGETG